MLNTSSDKESVFISGTLEFSALLDKNKIEGSSEPRKTKMKIVIVIFFVLIISNLS